MIPATVLENNNTLNMLTFSPNVHGITPSSLAFSIIIGQLIFRMLLNESKIMPFCASGLTMVALKYGNQPKTYIQYTVIFMRHLHNS